MSCVSAIITVSDVRLCSTASVTDEPSAAISDSVVIGDCAAAVTECDGGVRSGVSVSLLTVLMSVIALHRNDDIYHQV